MANITNSLASAMQLTDAMAVGLVDMASGCCVAGSGIEHVDLDAAAAENTVVLRNKKRLLQEMGSPDEIEEILITGEEQIHLIRMIRNQETASLFLFLALNRSRSRRRCTDLGLTRFKFEQIERELVIG